MSKRPHLIQSITDLVKILPAATLIFLCFSISASGQEKDSAYIKELYDRALDFGEARVDSLSIVAEIIDKKSSAINFENGVLLATRLKGIHAEYLGDYNIAINHYLKCLEIAREKKLPNYEASALSDLAYLYMELKNPAKAKEFYLETAKISLKRGEVHSVVTDLVNLGAIYNRLGDADSAIIYLRMAEEYVKGFENKIDLTSLRNNLGNAYFQKKNWTKAYYYFQQNYNANKLGDDKETLWYDVLNLADVFIETKQFDSASFFLDRAMTIAKELKSERLEADVYQLFSKFYQRRNNYHDAYAALQQWHKIDTSLVNAETRATMIQMEQRYHLKEKARENKLLVADVEAEKLRSRNISIAAFAIAGFAIVCLVFWYFISRKNHHLEAKNRLIQEQNSRLAELNAEKNSLISVVSHDLNTPFSSIKMWVQLLEADKKDLNENQLKAVERIKSSVDTGLNLIRDILDVEKVHSDNNLLELEKFDVLPLLKMVIGDQEALAAAKEIQIHLEHPPVSLVIMSDRQMLYRVFSNLLSNAIKFTPRLRNIYIIVNDKAENIEVIFRDEGLGIAPEEMKYLFAKYSKISTKSTEGEPSTGLGLSIVKRILAELNGNIKCLSNVNQGTTFTIQLKK